MALSQIVWSLDDKQPLPPAALENEAELESYNDIWKFLPSVSPEAPVPRPSHENGRK